MIYQACSITRGPHRISLDVSSICAFLDGEAPSRCAEVGNIDTGQRDRGPPLLWQLACQIYHLTGTEVHIHLRLVAIQPVAKVFVRLRSLTAAVVI